jgi:hypothetical protein
MAKRRRQRPKAWVKNSMGAWRDPKASKQVNAQNFAQARLGLLQQALGPQGAFGGATHLGANSTWAPQFNNLQTALQSTQGLTPQEQWARLSPLFAQLSSAMGVSDPRQLLHSASTSPTGSWLRQV